jgi:glycosyltransferase involved in cell wall biosynthesis
VVYSGVRASEPIARRESKRGDSVVIGTACRLIEAKGVRELVLAFAELKKEFPSLRLEVAGSGPEQEDLVNDAERCGVSEGVRFLEWVDDLRPVLRRWDVFALPSHEEALPVSILEAMAEGLPVVATNVGGIPELVEDERTGYLVEPRDVDGLRMALRRVVKDSTLRDRLGEQGRLRAETKFSVERMVSEVESIYESLLSSR